MTISELRELIELLGTEEAKSKGLSADIPAIEIGQITGGLYVCA
ncbi:MAG: hypothetical protein ACRCU6_08230 [Fusobacteriaceae bacterium]